MERRFSWRLVLFVLLAGLLGQAGTVAGARTLDSSTVQIIVTVPMWVTLDTDTGLLLIEDRDFVLTVDDTESGTEGILAVKPEALKLVARGNVDYSVMVSLESDALVSVDGEYEIPVWDLRWRRSEGDDEWWPLSTEDEPVIVQMEPGESIIDIDFLLLAAWDVPATTYTGKVVYTIIAHEPDQR